MPHLGAPSLSCAVTRYGLDLACSREGEPHDPPRAERQQHELEDVL